MIKEKFNLTTSPLFVPTLLEASAGTGKTFSIQYLVLRLLVERGAAEAPMSIEQVLLVTFTKAATAELKSRIRALLETTLRWARAGADEDARRASGDVSMLEALLARWRGNPTLLPEAASPQPGESVDAGILRVVADLMEKNLEHFDESAVVTIHGFCQSVLQDHNFAAGLAFGREVMPDVSEILDVAVEEELRSLIADPVFASSLESVAEVPVEQWKGLAQSVAELPLFRGPGRSVLMDWRVVKGIGGFNDAEFVDAFARGIKRRFEEAKRREGVVAFSNLLSDLLDAIEDDDTGELVRRVRERYKAVLIDEFQDTDPLQYAIFRRLFFADDVRGEYAAKSAPEGGSRAFFLVGDPKQSIYGFRNADLNTYFRARNELLEADGLAALLGTNFRSSPELVEFVNRAFSPKGLFATPTQGEDEGIVYEPVDANPGNACLGLYVNRDGHWEKARPFALWCTQPDYAVFDKQSDGLALYVEAIASEIAWYIEASGKALDEPGAVRIGDKKQRSGEWIEVDGTSVPVRPLRPADFAVLSRTKNELPALRAALVKRGLELRDYVERSVFDTDEAFDLLVVLEAVISPLSRNRLRAYLASTFCGRSFEEVASLGDETSEEGARLQVETRLALEKARARWNERGAAVAIGELMRSTGLAQRLLRELGGEQRLMHYRQLLECLHEAGLLYGTPTTLLVWYRKQVAEKPVDERSVVRVTGDEDRVTFMTIHSSKGLQFPIVYLHKVGSGNVRKTNLWVEHTAGTPGSRAMAQVPEDKPDKVHAAEQLSEEIRLLYVAFTRAEARVTVDLPLVLTKKTGIFSGVAYKGSMKEFFSASSKGMDVASFLQGLEAVWGTFDGPSAETLLGAKLPGDWIVSAPGTDGAARVGVLETADSSPAWSQKSFSSLSASADDAPSERRYATGARVEPEPDSILAFPRGAAAGTFLHELLENVDFQEMGMPSSFAGWFEGDVGASRDGRFFRTMRRLMTKHHFEHLLEDCDEDGCPHVAKALRKCVHEVFNRPLGGEGRTFRLKDIPPERRAAEMEFLLRLRTGADAAEFSDLVASLDPRYDVGTLSRESLKGYLTGFIDLVFFEETTGRWWVLDWKSNAVADTAEGFDEEAMDAEMRRHRYRLQYLIYLVALRRHLRHRLGDAFDPAMIGGAVYVFLRGVDAASPGTGIVVDEVDPHVLETLDEFLDGSDE